LIIALILVAVGIGAFVLRPLVQQTCVAKSAPTSTVSRSSLLHEEFGAIHKYRLAGQRSPNAIVAASDGSVWFGEQSLSGIGHLLLNGTLVEYKWPFQYPEQSFSTFIWGIAIWKGCVWASDQAGSQLVAVDPNTGSILTVKLEANSFPYTLTVGPDDSLWFTEVFASRIGRIDSQFHLSEYSTSNVGTPAQIAFVNDTLGFYVDTGNVGIVKPGIFSFNPQKFSPIEVGTERTLIAPTSLALASDTVFVAQHATSIIASYNLHSHEWRSFPTSPISYTATSLPYFVAANGTQIWFNEHYANRMAMLDTQHGLLTEYSLSEPPPGRITGIDNALTFAVSKDRTWFTELTANRVGYVDAGYKPAFTLSRPSISEIKIMPGHAVNASFLVSGHSQKPLTIQFADTENTTGVPRKVTMLASTPEIRSLNGQEEFSVEVAVDKTLPAGNYTLLVAITDGQTSQGAYLSVQITP
jgi:streptogramin lyase